jgi:hypothetical protein
MVKLLSPFALIILIYMQAAPAYCGVSRTMTFNLSVTIPEHVIFNSGLRATPFSNNTYQLVQTETVIRNNKSIRLTSIVVP